MKRIKRALVQITATVLLLLALPALWFIGKYADEYFTPRYPMGRSDRKKG